VIDVKIKLKTMKENEKLKTIVQRLSKFFLIVGLLLFLNVGNKFPVMSETTDKTSVESYNERLRAEAELEAKKEYEKYMQMYQEIYEKSLIQQIEFESEILIPDYFEFKYVEYAYQVSQELEVPTRVTFRLIFRESRFRDSVKSPVGAYGLMQLMPGTRKTYYNKLRLDTLNLDRNQEDIRIGLTYIKDLENYWRERGNSEKNLLKLSLAAYNAGPGAVMKYKGIPPFKETTNFVAFISRSHSNPTFYANIIKKNMNKDIS
jgi:soluble lytic murein transglycosylase-like protein